MEWILKRQNNDPKTITYAYQTQTNYWIKINNSQTITVNVDGRFSIRNMQLAINSEKKDTFHQIFQRTIKMRIVKKLDKENNRKIEKTSNEQHHHNKYEDININNDNN